MERYDEVLVQKPIRSSGKVVSGSHYNNPDRKYGRTRDAGDASPEVQRHVIDALVAAGKKAGLTDHDIASVLAIVRYESGFNPDAANRSSSAAGLGQFRNETRTQYGVHTVFDIATNAEAVVRCYMKSKSLAIEYRPGATRQELDRWTYGFYHDGPRGYDYGGNEIFSRPNGVEQWIGPMEKSLSEPKGNQHPRSSDSMGESGRLSAGAGPTSGPFVQGLPDNLNLLLGPIDPGTPGPYGQVVPRNLLAEPPQSDLLSLLDPASRYPYRNAFAGTGSQSAPGQAASVRTSAFGPPSPPFSPRPGNLLAQPFEGFLGGAPPATSPPQRQAAAQPEPVKPFYSLKDKLDFFGEVYPTAKRASEATVRIPIQIGHRI